METEKCYIKEVVPHYEDVRGVYDIIGYHWIYDIIANNI